MLFWHYKQAGFTLTSWCRFPMTRNSASRPRSTTTTTTTRLVGVGKDNHYVETSEGRLITGREKGRYVRFYSGGNNASDLNHYIEVEVYGK